MSRRYVVCWPNEYTDRDGNNRTDFMRIGTAFPLRDTDGFSVELSLSPPAAEAQRPTKLVLFAAKDEDQRDNRSNNRNNNRGRDDRDNRRYDRR